MILKMSVTVMMQESCWRNTSLVKLTVPPFLRNPNIPRCPQRHHPLETRVLEIYWRYCNSCYLCWYWVQPSPSVPFTRKNRSTVMFQAVTGYNTAFSCASCHFICYVLILKINPLFSLCVFATFVGCPFWDSEILRCC